MYLVIGFADGKPLMDMTADETAARNGFDRFVAEHPEAIARVFRCESFDPMPLCQNPPPKES